MSFHRIMYLFYYIFKLDVNKVFFNIIYFVHYLVFYIIIIIKIYSAHKDINTYINGVVKQVSEP